ncbi:MAG: TetR/AcrR family transcriptional regulator [Polyangiaceae bacterium]|nr:TetR/AcrR family transcriptional regulator [Polyangiaceae bacterium]
MAGRPRQFDREEALEKAMMLFWEKGFTATSMHDLLERMGISRQSLYNTFGDKRNLFLAALDHYKSKFTGRLWGTLSCPDASLPEIRMIFERVSLLAAPGGPKACMLASSCMEQGLIDDLVAGRARDAFEQLESLFERAIENAKRKGEVGDHVKSITAARLLANTLFGLGVLLRSGADEERVRDVVAGALSVLD